MHAPVHCDTLVAFCVGYTQVEDDAEGPQTKREYEVARVPVGVALSGQVVNFLGCPQGSQIPLGMDAQLPLLNDQLDMKSREQINTPLFTGVKVKCYVNLTGPSDRGAHANLLLSHALLCMLSGTTASQHFCAHHEVFNRVTARVAACACRYMT